MVWKEFQKLRNSAHTLLQIGENDTSEEAVLSRTLWKTVEKATGEPSEREKAPERKWRCAFVITEKNYDDLEIDSDSDMNGNGCDHDEDGHDCYSDA
jgi:hypothetical protein